jgi:hypothetical protein
MIELRCGVVARHANVGDAVDGSEYVHHRGCYDQLGGQFAGGASRTSWGVMLTPNCIDVLFWHLRRDSGREIFGVVYYTGGPDPSHMSHGVYHG